MVLDTYRHGLPMVLLVIVKELIMGFKKKNRNIWMDGFGRIGRLSLHYALWMDEYEYRGLHRVCDDSPPSTSLYYLV